MALCQLTGSYQKVISGCEISHLGESAVPGDAPTSFGTKLEKNLAWPSVAGSSGHNDAMASHVALLRGINVGGRNKVPMTDLREGRDLARTHRGHHLHPERQRAVQQRDTDTAKVAAALESAIGERFGIWILGGGPEPERAGAGPGHQSLSG